MFICLFLLVCLFLFTWRFITGFIICYLAYTRAEISCQVKCNMWFSLVSWQRQDYLYRELLVLEHSLPNVHLARHRYATIWGGASLLQMLLSSINELLELGWEWDFVINLSESDFPVKWVKVFTYLYLLFISEEHGCCLYKLCCQYKC